MTTNGLGTHPAEPQCVRWLSWTASTVFPCLFIPHISLPLRERLFQNPSVCAGSEKVSTRKSISSTSAGGSCPPFSPVPVRSVLIIFSLFSKGKKKTTVRTPPVDFKAGAALRRRRLPRTDPIERCALSLRSPLAMLSLHVTA